MTLPDRGRKPRGRQYREGQCALCLQSRRLERSHLMPAGIYRSLRNAEGPIREPVVVRDGIAVSTSAQVQTPLLCRDCEQRFSRNGESRIVRGCLKSKGMFQLRDWVQKLPLLAGRPGLEVYSIPLTEQNIASALGYFAMSIIWRHHAGRGRWPALEIRGDGLGPFAERARQFLLQPEHWPQWAALMITIHTDGEEFHGVLLPEHKRIEGRLTMHRFLIPGMGFILSVGNNLPGWATRTCAISGPAKPIILSPFHGGPMFKQFVQTIANSTPKGILGNLRRP